MLRRKHTNIRNFLKFRRPLEKAKVYFPLIKFGFSNFVWFGYVMSNLFRIRLEFDYGGGKKEV